MNRYGERIENLRKLFSEAGIDALYISGVANVAYFTGTNGSDCSLYISSDTALIITDFRYRELAQSLSGWLTLAETNNDVRVSDILADQKEQIIGLEKDHLLLEEYVEFTEKISGKIFKPVQGLVEELREIKDEYEIDCTKKAVAIADKAFEHMINFIKPGMTENECVAELEYFMKKEGADGVSFSTIFVSGVKSSMPHGVPDNKVIENGDFVTMDYGCKYKGYCSDTTRTFGIGSVSQKMKDIYNIVYEAQTAACAQIKAGITGKAADSIARDIIEKAGYGEFFGHSLGHGTGLEIHELPRYSQAYNKVIRKNTIVSIEPGIYLPKEFGVRIEDLALVTENGIINFVTAPKELLII